MRLKRYILVLAVAFLPDESEAQQFLMDMVDTTTNMGRGIFSIYQNYSSLKFSAYMQPQFQVAESKGAEGFAGGNFSPNVDNRFMLRRGHIRMDYFHYNKDHIIATNFVFQLDGTERGVFIRDFWGRFYENKWQLFSITTGMFARPFGYEVNLSSATRESPERGRMSQILMQTERDLDVMLSFAPRKQDAQLKWLKADIGIFNGLGLSGPVEYDNKKDIIGRVAIQPQKIKALGVIASAGVSVLQGGIANQSERLYKMEESNNGNYFYSDSLPANVGKIAPRQYYGADAQIKIPNKKGCSEFRAEYITGNQAATRTTSQTPGTYQTDATNHTLPLYVRPFNGAYFYYLQHLGTEKLQLVLKYDWYDPNTRVAGKEVTSVNGMTAADVRFDTFGFGGNYYVNPHMKFLLWYDVITNETTAIAGYDKDRKDNVLTVRIQYSF